MATESQVERRAEHEAGYMLLAVVVMVALVLIALSVAAPIVAKDLRRDKEVESERRAEQYVRAIRLYYAKTKSYPPSMDALEKTNNIRFLRQKYVDPLTGKSDWRIIHNPVTKTHIPFGQELSGLAGGLGSAAGLASPGGVGGTAGTANQTVTSTNSLNSGFGGAQIGGTSGSTGTSGATGSTGSSGGGMFGDSTGGVIMGVGTSRTGDSILNPNQQTTYETWEFWYDPQIELLYAKGIFTGGGGLGSQSATSMGTASSLIGASGATGASGASGGSGPSGPTGTTSTFP